MSELRLIHVETNRLGVTRKFWADDQANITVEAIQDLEPFVEKSKREQIERGKKLGSEVACPIGMVPHVIAMKWLHDEGWFVYDADKCEAVEKKLKQKLNDPDWRYLLRTSELRV